MKKFLLIISSILLLSGCNKENQVTTIIERDNNFFIGINYPITNNKKLDKLIKKDINNIYNSFKDEYQSFNSLKSKAELNIDYKLNKTAKFYSIAIEVYIGSSKSKQSINYTKTYFYNYKTNYLLKLKDILSKEDLNYIAKLTKKKINNSCDNINDIKNNILPYYKNYENFTITKDYLIFYINSKKLTNSCNNIIIKIPLEDLNLKIDFYQNTIKTSNEKVEIPSKTLDPNDKFIVLTFDDGPSKYTNQLIEVLKKNDCNATFFVLGNKVEMYKDTIRKSLNYGNEIGNHSYSHKWLIKLDEDSLNEQIDKTQQIIKEVTGHIPTLLRPTYGSVNNNIRKRTDLKIVLWNVDTMDWKYKNINRIVNRATKNAKDGNIILMHDIHERTVKAVEKIIPILKQQGYKFITVSEMQEIQLLRSKT